jgi:monoamine oxidase
MKADIIIIGAGAAGLAAARVLAKAGKRVTVLEARHRTGGRIFTIESAGFSRPVEGGAEFVHGDLPYTLNLLLEAGIAYQEMEGITWQFKDGKLIQNNQFIEDWPLLISRLQELTTDITIEEFLNAHFAEEKHKGLRESVTGFVQGYDAADISKASTFALRSEWTSEEEAAQYRLPKGYRQLIQFLEEDSKASGCSIHLSARVKEVRWQPGLAEVFTEHGQTFSASKILITVPLGILQAGENSSAYMRFTPPVSHMLNAARQIGFGGVIKFLFEFKEAFWEQDVFPGKPYRRMPHLGFLFSDAPVPTWWTQLPHPAPVLTGWLAGPDAARHQHFTESQLQDMALDSLASLFDVDKRFLEQQLLKGQVVNWFTDPFSYGAYSYATLNTPDAKKTLNQPLADTLYFAGEALYEGAEMGTVEAALASGTQAAMKIAETLSV